MFAYIDKPLIVQSDKTILLDTHSADAESARSAILPFTELEKSPEHIHTYRVTPLSLWNAAASGLSPEDVVHALEKWSRYAVPAGISTGFADTMNRYGKIRLIENEEKLALVCDDAAVCAEIRAAETLRKYLTETEKGFLLKLTDRGSVKWELIKLGLPVKDEASLIEGEPLDMSLRETLTVRDYQKEAAESVAGEGAAGYGVVCLPCGAGKTVVGMQVMALLRTNTLILTANTVAVRQWIGELLDKTGLSADQIAEYTGQSKQVAPVTVATYQILTWRPDKDADFPHFKLFRARRWGLIIYDEAHLLPAPVFRVTAELQAVRRLGLTATLVREDHEEGAVFSLV